MCEELFEMLELGYVIVFCIDLRIWLRFVMRLVMFLILIDRWSVLGLMLSMVCFVLVCWVWFVVFGCSMSDCILLMWVMCVKICMFLMKC